jgi:hypothetical protein
MKKSLVYLALLHYPMYNKRRDIITTSVTNLDLHDISRAARTYDADGFFIIHPSWSQHSLIREILEYWQEGYGGEYNPDRKEAFALVRTAENLDQVLHLIEQEKGLPVETVATDARVYPRTISYRDMRQKIKTEEKAFVLLFGTGWGLEREFLSRSHYILEPVEAGRDYNHLSVRSAVSIILDRLLGESWFETV